MNARRNSDERSDWTFPMSHHPASWRVSGLHSRSRPRRAFSSRSRSRMSFPTQQSPVTSCGIYRWQVLACTLLAEALAVASAAFDSPWTLLASAVVLVAGNSLAYLSGKKSDLTLRLRADARNGPRRSPRNAKDCRADGPTSSVLFSCWPPPEPICGFIGIAWTIPCAPSEILIRGTVMDLLLLAFAPWEFFTARAGRLRCAA